jgi:hypothetical protein
MIAKLCQCFLSRRWRGPGSEYSGEQTIEIEMAWRRFVEHWRSYSHGQEASLLTREAAKRFLELFE